MRSDALRDAEVPGWLRCPSCRRRFQVTHEARGVSLACGACDEPLEPILQPEREPRGATPPARLVSEGES